VRRGAPNEDAIGWAARDGALTVAVADGHGSDRCPRAAEGAQLAVQAVVDALGGLEQSGGLPNPEAFDGLRRDVVRAWLKALPEPQPLLFGTTAVGLLVTEGWLVAIQLGDGEVLIVDAAGDVSHLIAPDPLLLGNDTTGLATDDAAEQIRVRAFVLTERPRLLLMATDGYSNSFATPAGFHQAASDFSAMVAEDGLPSLEPDLVGWLDETSALGSGDDISVALIAWGPSDA